MSKQQQDHKLANEVAAQQPQIQLNLGKHYPEPKALDPTRDFKLEKAIVDAALKLGYEKQGKKKWKMPRSLIIETAALIVDSEHRIKTKPREVVEEFMNQTLDQVTKNILLSQVAFGTIKPIMHEILMTAAAENEERWNEIFEFVENWVALEAECNLDTQ